MNKKILTTGFALLIFWVLSCGVGSGPPVTVTVYGPPNGQAMFNNARTIKVVLTGKNIQPKTEEQGFSANGAIELKIPNIPFGSNRQLQVMLCANTCSPSVPNDIIAKGYSIPFSVNPGDKALQLFIYVTPINDFVPTAASYQMNGPQVTSPGNNANLVGSRSLVLKDGRVLITGGAVVGGNSYADMLKPDGISQVLNTAYIYEPNTNTFTTTPGAMVMPRAYHTMTLLPDGRVLLCGGFTMGAGKIAPTTSCETFDPETQLFQILSKNSSMKWTRAMHTATLISNTRPQVLFAGGKGTGSKSWEVLDIDAGGDIAYGTSLTAPRWNHTATLLQNYGKSLGTPTKVIALIGGENDTNVLDTVDMIDLDCNLKRQKVDTTGVCLNPGLGGMQSPGPLKIPGGGRTWHASVYVPSMWMIYVIGGFTKKDYSAATNRIDVFKEQQGDFFFTSDPNNPGKKRYLYLKLDTPVAAAAASLQYKNRLNTVLITGGIAFGNKKATDNASVILEVLSAQNGASLKVASTKTAMPVAIAGHQSIMLNTQRVLIFGGITANNNANTESFLYTFQ